MQNFLDHTSHVKKQTFSAAVILDAKGKMRGRIVVRFTPSQIGYNHQVGAIVYGTDLDFNTTQKGGTYDQPQSLVKLLKAHGMKAIHHNGDELSDCHGRFDDCDRIKHGRKVYRVIWAI